MLADIDKDTVDFVPNYDETQPGADGPAGARSRTCWSTASAGIAVGMATNIPPHNLGEVVDASSTLIEHPEATVDELLPCSGSARARTSRPAASSAAAPASRRPTRPAAARSSSAPGRQIEDVEEGRPDRIVVTEIPYQVNKATLIEKIAELVQDKAIEGIADLRDESDREGMRIVIELKRGEVRRSRPEQALQAHAAADDLRDHHAGDRRRPAAGALAPSR